MAASSKKESQKKSKRQSPARYNPDDELIDLREQVMKVWKWRWPILVISLVAPLLTFAYLSLQAAKTKPKSPVYEAQWVLQVGKFGSMPIAWPNNVRLDLLKAFPSLEITANTSNWDINEIWYNTDVTITATAPTENRDKQHQKIDAYLDDLVVRHRRIYRDAKNKLNRIQELPSRPQMLLSTYTFPTRIVSRPAYPLAEKKSKTIGAKKMAKKVAFALFAALFLSMLAAYLWEHAKNIFRWDTQ